MSNLFSHVLRFENAWILMPPRSDCNYTIRLDRNQSHFDIRHRPGCRCPATLRSRDGKLTTMMEAASQIMRALHFSYQGPRFSPCDQRYVDDVMQRRGHALCGIIAMKALLKMPWAARSPARIPWTVTVNDVEETVVMYVTFSRGLLVAVETAASETASKTAPSFPSYASQTVLETVPEPTPGTMPGTDSVPEAET